MIIMIIIIIITILIIMTIMMIIITSSFAIIIDITITSPSASSPSSSPLLYQYHHQLFHHVIIMSPSCHHHHVITFSCQSMPCQHAARSIRLRDAAYLKEAVESMLQLLFSDYSQVRVASAATLSRARRKLDVAMMYLRRQTISDIGIPNLSIQLSYLPCN